MNALGDNLCVAVTLWPSLTTPLKNQNEPNLKPTLKNLT